MNMDIWKIDILDKLLIKVLILKLSSRKGKVLLVTKLCSL